jgi:hypothetical protein
LTTSINPSRHFMMIQVPRILKQIWTAEWESMIGSMEFSRSSMSLNFRRRRTCVAVPPFKCHHLKRGVSERLKRNWPEETTESQWLRGSTESMKSEGMIRLREFSEVRSMV